MAPRTLLKGKNQKKKLLPKQSRRLYSSSGNFFFLRFCRAPSSRRWCLLSWPSKRKRHMKRTPFMRFLFRLSLFLQDLGKFVVFKVGVMFTTLFLFFTTTTLVSFTLRETQARKAKALFDKAWGVCFVVCCVDCDMWSSLCGTVDDREEASCTVPRVLLPHRKNFLRLLFEVFYSCCVQDEVYCYSDGVCGIVDGYSNMERSKQFDRFALCLRHAASVTWRFLYYFSLSSVRSRFLSSGSCLFFRAVTVERDYLSRRTQPVVC